MIDMNELSKEHRDLIARLRALPAHKRRMLVVRSQPFGDIIEDDTRVIHGHISDPELAYRVVRAAK
jgi:hypothetical protein